MFIIYWSCSNPYFFLPFQIKLYIIERDVNSKRNMKLESLCSKIFFMLAHNEYSLVIGKLASSLKEGNNELILQDCF